MRILIYTIAVTLGILFAACHNPQPDAVQLLKQAEQFVEEYPDSAMQRIDSIFYPEKSLDGEQYMRFLVRQVQTKYKTRRTIQEDTLIFRARDYFSIRNKDPRLTVLAWFYSGCIHRERKEYTEAMRHYNTAGDFEVIGIYSENRPITVMWEDNTIVSTFNKNLGYVLVSIINQEDEIVCDFVINTITQKQVVTPVWELAPGTYTITFSNNSGAMYGDFEI